MVSDTPEKRMELLRQGQLLAGKTMTYGIRENTIEAADHNSNIPAFRSFLFRTVICMLLYVTIAFAEKNTPWRQQVLETLSVNYVNEESAMVFEFLQSYIDGAESL